MVRRQYAAAPRWDDHELDRQRKQAIEKFVIERSREGGASYRSTLAESLLAVERLFDRTNDLLDLATGKALADEPFLAGFARYLGGPPLSADDLDTFTGLSVSSRRQLPEDLARQVAKVIEAALDRDRFPWLFASPSRGPTTQERDIARKWTAGLHAAQRTQTARRGESSARQEAAVGSLLVELGFKQVVPRHIDVTTDLGKGEFCWEAIVISSKCDIPIGLRDGRFLFLECKVSNSAINSVERLNRETGGKAREWNRAFGERALTGAVLAGVYKLRNLKDAQDTGVCVFWEHDLQPLSSFLSEAS
jgi:hypothetical protein